MTGLISFFSPRFELVKYKDFFLTHGHLISMQSVFVNPPEFPIKPDRDRVLFRFSTKLKLTENYALKSQ
jgi:hypothetical protein